MKIKDLNKRDDLQLVTDSQDVKEINNYLGWNDSEFQGYFVKVQDGDYVEVYGFNERSRGNETVFLQTIFTSQLKIVWENIENL